MLRNLTPTLLLAVLVVGCAKEKAYKTDYKEPEIVSRSDIKMGKTVIDKDGNKRLEAIQYMYVPMSLGTPRQVKAASPFEQGTEKVVKIKWSKKGLEVVEFEKDNRFSDNDLNDVPVLTIPGEYVGYRCAEDDFGDCTNEEEVVDDVSWEQKGSFIPDYAEITVKEVNSLDLYNVGGDLCHSQIDSNVVDYEISDGVINVELEKTYQLNKIPGCVWRQYAQGIPDSHNSFKVRFFYSLVELEQLTTPGYQPIDYPAADHDEFGFFETEVNTLEDNFDPNRKVKTHMVNRWSPNRKNGELVYYLSKNLSKPENKILLDATYKAVKIMNVGLTSANSPFKIVIKEQKLNEKEVSPGDLRYNTIVLIEDPLANGLLGYGPSVTNPFTGEIVQAHTNMYGGVLKSIVRRVYESAVDLTEADLKKSNEVLTDITVADSAFEGLPNFIKELNNTPAQGNPAQQDNADQNQGASANVSLAMQAPQARVSANNSKKLSSEEIEQMLSSVTPKQLEMLKKPKFDLADYKQELTQMMNGDFGQMDELDIQNFKDDKKAYGLGVVHKHKPEYFPIGGTTKKVYPALLKISGMLTSKGSLKRWSKLNQSQKDEVLNIILSKSWISTLVHELGHNLGLRHNFSGSHDKDNFFTAEEAKNLGYDEVPAYSSVMDYSYSKYNQLRSFGKYDIAALKFAYAREIEVEMVKNTITKEGSRSTEVLSVKTEDLGAVQDMSVKALRAILQVKNETLTKSDEVDESGATTQFRYRVKPYEFCTDGHAGLSSTCNRFDEGTSLTEIAKFRVENYNKLYEYRNFRDGRVDYSAYDVGSYVGARNYEFGQIRDIFEEIERYTQNWDIGLISTGCDKEQAKIYVSQCRVINDAKGALDAISNHFINILKTPDHICALATEENATEIIEYKTLFELNNDWYLKYEKGDIVTSCFDPVVKKALADQKVPLVVVGETGKFLNGFKGVNTDHKYVTDRAVLGTWPDKVMAMKFLFKRRWRNGSTDSDHMALIDVPAVQQEVMGVLAHYIMGEKLVNPVPFTSESGASFEAPYVIGSNYKIEQVEDYFSDLKRYLGLSANGRSNLVNVTLNQIKKIGVNYGEEGKTAAHNAINLIAVRRFNSTGSENLESFSAIDSGDYTYAAGDNTPLAKYMISSIIMKKALDNVEKAVIEKVVAQRMNPVAPAELTAEQAVFFALDISWQVALIDYKEDNAPFTIDVFTGQFGAEAGPSLFKMYTEGVKAMSTMKDLKLSIADVVPADATEDEKLTYQFELSGLQQYLQGGLTVDRVDFYTKQLSRLPNYTTESLL
jgi:hypothetical protein